MKKTILTLTLLLGISLSLFAQREIPMFFDGDMGLETGLIRGDVKYSPDGSKVARQYNTFRNIAIWDVASGRELVRFAGDSKGINNIVFSPNGKQITAFANSDSVIKIWDAQTGALIRSISQSNVQAIAFSPDGSRIASAFKGTGDVYGIKIWNTANGNEIRNITVNTAIIHSVAYSPDGKQILTASDDDTIRIWDSGNGQNIRTINVETRLRSAIFSPNGQQIAAYSLNVRDRKYAIWLFNTASEKELISIPVRLYQSTFVYSPDGKSLLANVIDDNGNFVIKIFDPNTGRELRSLNNGNLAMFYSPDGRKILTGSSAFELKIGDTTYGASYANILDATTGRTIGTIGYGPLNVGAKAFADLQIARFLGDTAAVGRHEAVLKFITDKGYATRAEIEAFYRDNVRALIAGVMDEEFKGITVPASTIAYVKDSLINFYLTPNQANFNILKSIYDVTNKAKALQDFYEANIANAEAMEEVFGKGSGEGLLKIANDIKNNDLPRIGRQLNAPNNAPIDWGGFSKAYWRVLNNLNTELAKKMWG
jgi:WD40 repeat protein